MRSFFRAGTLPPGTFRSRGARLPPRRLARKAPAADQEPGPGSFEALKLGALKLKRFVWSLEARGSQSCNRQASIFSLDSL